MKALSWHGQLSHIALGCPDVDACANFYCDVVGLTRHEDTVPGEVKLGWGVGQHALDLIPGPPVLHHFGLEIPDEGELEGLLEHVRSRGVQLTDYDLGAGAPRGYGLLDPEGRQIVLHGRVNRSGEHSADPGRRPVRLQHITLASADLENMVEFYVDTLRFRVSDRMGEVFVWLRCGTEHHTVAIVSSDTPRKLDHFSFDLNSWEDFKVWSDRLSEHSQVLSWGPGRHGPGNNLFLMFDDPAGYHVELSSEMEHYFDDLAHCRPRHWDATARSVNLWGPVPSWRQSQAPAEADVATA